MASIAKAGVCFFLPGTWNPLSAPNQSIYRRGIVVISPETVKIHLSNGTGFMVSEPILNQLPATYIELGHENSAVSGRIEISAATKSISDVLAPRPTVRRD